VNPAGTALFLNIRSALTFAQLDADLNESHQPDTSATHKRPSFNLPVNFSQILFASFNQI